MGIPSSALRGRLRNQAEQIPLVVIVRSIIVDQPRPTRRAASLVEENGSRILQRIGKATAADCAVNPISVMFPVGPKCQAPRTSGWAQAVEFWWSRYASRPAA